MSTRWLNLTSVTGDRVMLRAAAISAAMPLPRPRSDEMPQDVTGVYVTGNEVPFAVTETPDTIVMMVEISMDDAAREARGQGPLNGPGRR